MSPSKAKLGEQLAAGLDGLGLALQSGAREHLVDYLLLLDKWNRRYNLTAVRDPEEMVSRHLLDSLSVLPFLKGTRILDVGTGPGLPGIPIAIARPDCNVTLLDSVGKKIRFLTEAKRNLGLENIEINQ